MSENSTATPPAAASREDQILAAAKGEHTDPIHRVSYSFRRDGDDLWVYTWLEPDAHLPAHFHPVQEEAWETLEGTAEVRVCRKWRHLRPEDGPVLIERNVRHELKNTSGRTARMRTRVMPAGELEEFLTESARAAQEGLYNARNLPTGVAGARWLVNFALRHRGETVMCSPPPVVQRVTLPVAKRLLG
jgi:mannose-6-phosphate isomerase-like protein (cupin superfamily)